MADIYVEGYGAYIGTKSAEWQYGGGGTLGFGLDENFGVLYRGMYTIYTATASSSNPQEESHSHMMHMAGLEYLLPLDMIRCEWRSSIMMGFSMTTLSYAPTSGVEEEKMDMGPALAFWTGIQFNATQHLSPFVDIGFHTSFYTQSLEEKQILGLHIMAGVRFYIGGNRRIANNY